jgi:hypothetical protein
MDKSYIRTVLERDQTDLEEDTKSPVSSSNRGRKWFCNNAGLINWDGGEALYAALHSFLCLEQEQVWL